MQKELLAAFIMLLFSTTAYSQPIKKIYLLYDRSKRHHGLFDAPYRLTNQKDTAYIRFSSTVDMGAVSWSFSIKRNIPDGTYQLYINDTLLTQFNYKNGLVEGKYTHYRKQNYDYAGVTHSTEWYHKGIKFGEYHEWNSNNTLVEYRYTDTTNKIRYKISYYDDGKLKRHDVYLKGQTLCQEEFDEEGRIMFNKYANPHNVITHSTNKYKNGRLHGEVMRVYKSGRFEFVYDNSKILEWKYFDFEKQEYTARYPEDTKGLPK